MTGKGGGVEDLLGRFLTCYDFDDRAKEYISVVPWHIQVAVISFGGDFAFCEHPSSLLVHLINLERREGKGTLQAKAKGEGKGMCTLPQSQNQILRICAGELEELEDVFSCAPNLAPLFRKDVEQLLEDAEQQLESPVALRACRLARYSGVNPSWVNWVEKKLQVSKTLSDAELEGTVLKIEAA
eukprot:TRINITY_DN111462_c0_g1_i1.p1 TRINITY_DN111462_c0_g1~~TRINITY_DN111462_c0_g1_i1.p1  ORF type:complete len:184 (-),score=30.03 TRINITY_DN111462_c0_g1_i1:60-611(-)